MSADIIQFRKKPTPHPEYEAWAAAREKARIEFEKEQLRVPPREWSRPTRHMDLNVEWGREFTIPISAIIGFCCFGAGLTIGIILGVAASI